MQLCVLRALVVQLARHQCYLHSSVRRNDVKLKLYCQAPKKQPDLPLRLLNKSNVLLTEKINTGEHA